MYTSATSLTKARMKWTLTVILWCAVWIHSGSTQSQPSSHLMGCGPPPGTDCKNVAQYEMEDEYGGFCLVCIDSMMRPEFCLERVRCPQPQAGFDCENVTEVLPKGPSCQPACLVCQDNVEKLNYACPRPHFGHYSNPRGAYRSEPRCNHDNQCAADEKCCLWFGVKYCLKGIDTTPREGSCPHANDRRGCAADYNGCLYDSECPGEKKCCQNYVCRYKDCKTPTRRLLTAPGQPQCRCPQEPGSDCKNVRLERSQAPGCDLNCKVCIDQPNTTIATTTADPRKNLACPEPKTWFPTKRSERRCGLDSQCRNDEKCCSWFGDLHCLKGLEKTPKDGICQNTPHGHHECMADFVGCEYDSECSGDQKCCRNSACHYKKCQHPAKIYYGAAAPKVCTREACGPEPTRDCQKVKEERPNGPGCEPVCRVCDDSPTNMAASDVIQREVCEERYVRFCPKSRSRSQHNSRCRFRKKRVCQ